MQQGRGLDDQLKNEEQIAVICEVAELAKRCLRIKGDERPTMREVAEELQRSRKSTVQEQHKSEELETFRPIACESSITVFQIPLRTVVWRILKLGADALFPKM